VGDVTCGATPRWFGPSAHVGLSAWALRAGAVAATLALRRHLEPAPPRRRRCSLSAILLPARRYPTAPSGREGRAAKRHGSECARHSAAVLLFSLPFRSFRPRTVDVRYSFWLRRL